MEGSCWGALVALGKLPSLRALTVGVWEPLEDPLQAQLFLSAVSHVPEVWLSGVGQRMNEVHLITSTCLRGTVALGCSCLPT
jgi:hypothetical protein